MARTKGEGSIFKRPNGLWVAQLYVNGKKKVKYSKVQKEVRDWLHEQKEAVNKGTYIDSKDITLGTFLEQHMASQVASLRPRTANGYFILIRNHIIPELGSVKLSQLRADMVQNFYSQQMESFSNRTVLHMHALLHKALDQAMRFGLVVRNVTDLVDPPRQVKTEPEIWTVDQARKFLEQVKVTRYYPMFCLSYLGLRESEILGLYTENFNREHHIITVNHSLHFVPTKGLIIQEPKSRASVRTIKLPEFAHIALCNHIDNREENLKFLFTTESGKPLNPRFYYKKFKEYSRLAGLPEVKLHACRHFAISYLINVAHIPPSIVQQIVGHASPMLTLSVYTHSTTEQQNEAMEKMGDAFK